MFETYSLLAGFFILWFASSLIEPIPTAANLPADYHGACHSIFDKPSALVLKDDVPFVFASNQVIEQFSPGVSGGSQYLLKTCHNINGIINAVAADQSGVFYVATADQIDRVYLDGKGGSAITGALFPGISKGDKIEAFSVGSRERLLVVITTYGSDKRSRFLYFNHFTVGHPSATFKFTTTYTHAAVNSVAFGRGAEILTYGNDGMLFSFSRKNGTKAEIFAKRVASVSFENSQGLTGSRQLAADSQGAIALATDHHVHLYAADKHGTYHQINRLAVGDEDDLIDGIGFDREHRLFVLTHSIASDDAPLVSIFGAYAQGKNKPWTPLKRDYLNLTDSK